jgi:hypothetical protein
MGTTRRLLMRPCLRRSGMELKCRQKGGDEAQAGRSVCFHQRGEERTERDGSLPQRIYQNLG